MKTMAETQTYQNHPRWFPLFHFVITPLLAVLIIWAAACMMMEFQWWRVQILLLAISVGLVGLAARIQALKVQDRLIHLEETLRYSRLLDPELAEKAKGLKLSQIIALRFASDEELPDIVRRTISGEFATPKDIKLAIRSWRGDHRRV